MKDLIVLIVTVICWGLTSYCCLRRSLESAIGYGTVATLLTALILIKVFTR